jgi:hypothetical protein
MQHKAGESYPAAIKARKNTKSQKGGEFTHLPFKSNHVIKTSHWD